MCVCVPVCAYTLGQAVKCVLCVEVKKVKRIIVLEDVLYTVFHQASPIIKML